MSLVRLLLELPELDRLNFGDIQEKPEEMEQAILALPEMEEAMSDRPELKQAIQKLFEKRKQLKEKRRQTEFFEERKELDREIAALRLLKLPELEKAILELPELNRGIFNLFEKIDKDAEWRELYFDIIGSLFTAQLDANGISIGNPNFSMTEFTNKVGIEDFNDQVVKLLADIADKKSTLTKGAEELSTLEEKERMLQNFQRNLPEQVKIAHHITLLNLMFNRRISYNVKKKKQLEEKQETGSIGADDEVPVMIAILSEELNALNLSAEEKLTLVKNLLPIADQFAKFYDYHLGEISYNMTTLNASLTGVLEELEKLSKKPIHEPSDKSEEELTKKPIHEPSEKPVEELTKKEKSTEELAMEEKERKQADDTAIGKLIFEEQSPLIAEQVKARNQSIDTINATRRQLNKEANELVDEIDNISIYVKSDRHYAEYKARFKLMDAATKNNERDFNRALNKFTKKSYTSEFKSFLNNLQKYEFSVINAAYNIHLQRYGTDVYQKPSLLSKAKHVRRKMSQKISQSRHRMSQKIFQFVSKLSSLGIFRHKASKNKKASNDKEIKKIEMQKPNHS